MRLPLAFSVEQLEDPRHGSSPSPPMETIFRTEAGIASEARGFDCICSLFNHGVAQRERLNLGNLNPIYARELTKLGVYHEVAGG